VLGVLRSTRFPALLGVSILVALACAAAGAWQVQRFDEKRAANHELRANDAAPARSVAEVLAVGQPAARTLKFRKVIARGEYDPAGQVLVRKREVDGQLGFLVLTPLRTSAGPVLYLVRGFVPATGAATETPTVPEPPSGQVTLTGRVYPSESGGLRAGLPPSQVDAIDVPALAAQQQVQAYGGYAELVSSEPVDTALPALPAPDLSNPAGGAFTAQHLAYVVQWFLFALLALGAPVVFTRLDRQRANGPPRPSTDDFTHRLGSSEAR
jgi:cytochrome oxidase assembly protein ShyY1